MKILIIKTGALGDVLRTTSVLKPLLNKYPNAEIHWLTRKDARDLLRNNQFISKIILFEDMKNRLDEAFDLVISLDDEEELCRIAARVRSRKIVGAYFDEGRKTRAYTPEGEEWFGMGLLRPAGKGGLEKANELKAKNAKSYQQHLLEMLGLENKGHDIILNLDHADIEFAARFAEQTGLSKGNLTVGFNTGSADRWRYKRIEINLAVKLANKLNKVGAKVLLLGGPNEEERNENIKRKVNFNIIDSGTKNSLLQFAALVNLCDIVISSDSLCLQIALGLKKRVIGFFGPTSSSEIEMYGMGKKVLPKLDCVCCYRKECNRTPNCTESIDIDEIMDIVESMSKDRLNRARERNRENHLFSRHQYHVRP